jgi:hypothetical protein
MHYALERVELDFYRVTYLKLSKITVLGFYVPVFASYENKRWRDVVNVLSL